jgi:excisionase family DNA binding protein
MPKVTAMPSVMETGRSPRYGSAAELATYAGLSVKTIRRLVDAGKVRGRKVGRRLLIPFEDIDAHILRIEDHRRPTVQATLSQSSFDARGRAIPLPADEERRRAEQAIRALDELDEMGDDDEQRATFATLVAAVDEDGLSARRRFAE